MSGSQCHSQGNLRAVFLAAPDLFYFNLGLILILVRERQDALAFYINKADLTSTRRPSQPANQGAVKRVRPGGCLEGQEERARSHWSSPLQRPQPSYANKLGSFPPCCCPRQSPASLDTTPFTQRVEDLRRARHDTWRYGPRPPKRPSLITRQVLHARCFKPRLLRVPTGCQALGAHTFVGAWGGTFLGSKWGQWGLRSGRACTQKRKKGAGAINKREAGRAAPGSSLLCGLGWTAKLVVAVAPASGSGADPQPEQQMLLFRRGVALSVAWTG